MIEIELPDGSIAEFPDGTSDDVIQGALQKQFGGPQPSQPQPPPQSDQMTANLAELSGMTQNWSTAAGDRARFDALPTWKKPLVAAVDMADVASQVFGWRDKAAAGVRSMLTGNPYEDELETMRGQSQAARNRAGSAQVAGDIAPILALGGAGATLSGRLGTGAMTGAGGLAARSALMGLEGAGYGVLDAAGNDRDIGAGALVGAAAGIGGNVAGEALTAGLSKAAGAFNAKPTIPSLDDINAAKTAAYDAAEQAGVTYTPQAVDRLSHRVVTDLADIGYDPALQPGAAAVLKRLDDLQGQNVTLKGLDSLRKVANNGYIPGNKSNNLAIGRIIDAIDGAIDNPQAADVLMGNAQTGAAAMKEARSYASRSAKLQAIDDAVNRADLRAASTGSGGNVDNATRQNLRRILERPRGYTPDEREALEAVVRGTGGQNALRLAGKLSPSGNGLMAALGVGGAMVNPLVGAASLGGMASKAVADRMTQTNVQKLADIVAAGGSKAATQAPKNAAQRLAESQREAIIRIIMGGGLSVAGAN